MRCWILGLIAGCGPGSGPDSGGPPGGSTPPAITGTVQVGQDDAQAHHAWLTVTLSSPAAVTASCTLDTDPDEVHSAQSPTVQTGHTLDLHGLLADAMYRCEVDVDDQPLDTIDLLTPQGTLLPAWTVTSTGPMQGVWTVFNVWSVGQAEDQKFVVVDPEGRPRFWAPIEGANEGGVEVAWSPSKGQFLAGGGNGYNPAWIDLSGTTTHQLPDPESFGKYHHDVVQLDGDLVAALSQASDLTPWDEPYEGFAIEQRDLSTGALDQIWLSQDLVDAGTLLPGLSGPMDRYHANALQWVEDDPDGPAWWISLAHKNRIIRVDAATGALTWQLGLGGDFTLQDPEGNALGTEEWFFMQHDPEVSLPYLLVHDNGEARVGGTNYSRVVEYELDIENRVVTKRWDWTEPGWYETVFGDADRLPGDHVLITQGHCFICPHGDPSRYSALTEVDQSTDEVVWRLSMEEPQPGLYRAQRLDGCELFSNRKYCEALR